MANYSFITKLLKLCANKPKPPVVIDPEVLAAQQRRKERAEDAAYRAIIESEAKEVLSDYTPPDQSSGSGSASGAALPYVRTAEPDCGVFAFFRDCWACLFGAKRTATPKSKTPSPAMTPKTPADKGDGFIYLQPSPSPHA